MDWFCDIHAKLRASRKHIAAVRLIKKFLLQPIQIDVNGERSTAVTYTSLYY